MKSIWKNIILVFGMRHDAMVRLWRIKRFIVPMNVKGWEIFGCDNVATKGWFVCYQIVAGVLCDVIVQGWFVFKSLPKVFSVYHKIMQENRGACVVYQKLTCMLRRKRLLGVDNKKMASYAWAVEATWIATCMASERGTNGKADTWRQHL
jgi:hypothetical protein